MAYGHEMMFAVINRSWQPTDFCRGSPGIARRDESYFRGFRSRECRSNDKRHEQSERGAIHKTASFISVCVRGEDFLTGDHRRSLTKSVCTPKVKTATTVCGKCGARISGDATREICPACLLEHGLGRFDAEDETAIGSALPPRKDRAMRPAVWHLAAFFASLPSRSPEIDDKLPSNSS
jgi:hypothetical protein